jgi:hypothetical protein
MAIDPLSSISQLIDALRHQVNSAKEVQQAAATQVARQGVPVKGSHAEPSQRTERRRDMKALENNLRTRIGKISRDAPQPLETSVRVFVEGVLRWEFGDELARDTRFHQMLDDIVGQLCGDEALSAQFRQLFDGMKGEGK